MPYDLTVFQLGNAACHDYMWAYLFRYPGLVVLHDAQLHQARAFGYRRGCRAARTTSPSFAPIIPTRRRTSASWSPPASAGRSISTGRSMRLVVERARLTVVHNRRLLEDLRERYPAARFEHVEMGVGDPLARARHRW